LLFNLAKICSKNSSIVEIGSFKGGSTVYLANGSKKGNNCKVYAIDTFKGSPQHNKNNPHFSTLFEFKKNILEEKANDIVIPIINTSENARKIFDNKKIGLLFIDGNHNYNFVKQDFMLWRNLIINGGIIVFHDTLSGGARKVVKEFLYFNKFKEIKYLSSITYAKKTEKLCLKDKLFNLFSFIKRNLYLRIRWFYYLIKGKKYTF